MQALQNVSLDLFHGEIVSLLGVNGSGKTTLSSILSTLIMPTSGDILFHGQSIYKSLCEFRYIIGFCPQKPNLNNQLTVEENLYNDALYFGFTKQKARQKLEELVEKLKLKKYLKSLPMVLSGGYKQRVMIARALMHDPKIVIFDEPTVGLDPHIRYDLWNIIKGLKKDEITVLLTTHYLDEAEQLSDRICILEKGKTLLIDTPENLKAKHQKSNLEQVFIKLMQEEAE